MEFLDGDNFRWFPDLPSSDDENLLEDEERDIRLSENVLMSKDDEWRFPNKICKEARESLTFENAGGNSDVSEAASIQYFHELGYTDFIFENFVTYKTSWKMVDFVATAPHRWETNVPELIKNDSERVGVSVTRAADYGKGFDAFALLYKKIKGLIGARNNVTADSKFYRSILHIWCSSVEVAYAIKKAYDKILEDPTIVNSPDLKGTFKVITTICSDYRIYKNYKGGLE